MKRLLLLTLLCLPTLLRGQAVDSTADARPRFRDHLTIGADVNTSYLLPYDDVYKNIMHNYVAGMVGANVQYRTTPRDANAYDAAWGFPTLEAGVIFAPMKHIKLWRKDGSSDYKSTFGDMLTLYAGFRRDLLRKNAWTLGYHAENGIGFAFQPYNKRTNVDNEIIGSTYNIFVAFGFFANYRLSSRWSVGLDLAFRHFSNGTLDRPNKGINAFGASVRANYDLEPAETHLPVKAKGLSGFKKYVYVDVLAGMSAKTLLDHYTINYWARDPSDPQYRSEHYPIYTAFTAAVAPMWRYGLRYASGLELDYTYAPYADKIKALDESRGQTEYSYSRHVLGIGLRHEAFFRHFSVSMAFGWYAFRKMGYTADIDERPYYEKIGVRYNFPFSGDRLFIGYNVKAHLNKADCMQLTLGWRFIPKKHIR